MNNQVLIDDVRQFASSFELAEQLKGKSFFITGGTGLIGSVLIKCLLALNAQRKLGVRIVAVVRDLEKAKNVFGENYNQIEFLKHDLFDLSNIKLELKPNYVIHLACPTASKYFVDYPVETLRAIFEGTTSVLEYARIAGIDAMVFASSLEVYGTNLSDDCLDEDYQGYLKITEVRSSYNMGKRAAECLCHSYAKEYGVPVKIARMTQTFGAGVEYNDNRVFAQFARKAIEGQDIELHTTGETKRMYCYTTDAISAILYLLLKGENGEAYNIANKDSYISIREMAQMICERFNPSVSPRIVLQGNNGYAPVTKLNMDTRKMEALGWKPMVSLESMFDRLIRSMS